MPRGYGGLTRLTESILRGLTPMNNIVPGVGGDGAGAPTNSRDKEPELE